MKLTRSFPAEASSVPAARRFASELLADAPGELREAVELMVSELATNCIRHVNASFELTIDHHEGKVHVEVRDRAEGRPAMRSPAPAETQGRGLRIVDLLAARWGVRYDADAGKTVWFTLLASPQEGKPARDRRSQTPAGGASGSGESGPASSSGSAKLRDAA